MISIGIEDFRLNLPDILDRARYKREAFQIERHGKPLALLIPIDSIPVVNPPAGQSAELTAAQKRFGALARMIPSEPKT